MDHDLGLQCLLWLVSTISVWQSLEHLLQTKVGAVELIVSWISSETSACLIFVKVMASWLSRPTWTVYVHASRFAVMASLVSMLMFKALMTRLTCLPRGLAPFTNSL